MQKDEKRSKKEDHPMGDFQKNRIAQGVDSSPILNAGQMLYVIFTGHHAVFIFIVKNIQRKSANSPVG
ncbi:hypothetical protein LJC36_00905 [Desulfovibrio sp. OttesenSCG-928-C14]|nr:hypothetical protein [Desulfovibrio sp. OttesenSCG-928-C14]